MSTLSIYFLLFGSLQNLLAGELVGVVCDMFGTPIEGASVRAVSADTTIERSARSRSDGAFDLGIVPPGVYTVTFRRQGYHQKVLSHFIDKESINMVVALRQGRLFISKAHVIRGSVPSDRRRRSPLTVTAVARFDSTVSSVGNVLRSGTFTIRVSIPGDYLVGLEDEIPDRLTKCRYAGNRDLSVDLAKKNCVPAGR